MEEEKEEVKPVKPIKPEKTVKMVKIGVKDKVAFLGNREGENITIWGNVFAIGEKGELTAEVPEFIAKEGVTAGRYVIL